MLNPFSLISLVIAITIHEFAHAFAADRLGDPTPRSQDRLTLNPLKHLDPIGTVMLFLVGFGWGKPVAIDAYNFAQPRRDEIITSLAGPASNILLAVIVSLIIRFTGNYHEVLLVLVQINLMLAFFNLIPIPPLDGSKVLLNILPLENSVEIEHFFDRFGIIILIAAMILPFGSSNLVSALISPPIQFMFQLLLG
jgi:Zn-dependent protease